MNSVVWPSQGAACGRATHSQQGIASGLGRLVKRNPVRWIKPVRSEGALLPRPGSATRNGGWGVGARRSSARVRVLGQILNDGEYEERGPATGYAVSGQPDGNRVVRSSVRPVAVGGQPGLVEATAPPPTPDSYAAAVDQQPGRSPRSRHRLKIAKRVSRSAGDNRMGEKIRDVVLFLSATSSLMLFLWVGTPCLGMEYPVKHTSRSGG